MNTTMNSPGLSEIQTGKFHLPLSAEAILLNREGALQVARFACRMATKNASPIESDKDYALKFATFLAGTVAAQCNNKNEWFWVFDHFLKRVHRYLETGCNPCSDEEHDWRALTETCGEFHAPRDSSIKGDGDVQCQ
jgi:hypothetical protein